MDNVIILSLICSIDGKILRSARSPLADDASRNLLKLGELGLAVYRAAILYCKDHLLYFIYLTFHFVVSSYKVIIKSRLFNNVYNPRLVIVADL